MLLLLSRGLRVLVFSAQSLSFEYMKLNLGPSVLIYSVAKGATKVTCSCSIRAGIGILLWCCNYIENPQQPIEGRLRHVNSGSGVNERVGLWVRSVGLWLLSRAGLKIQAAGSSSRAVLASP